MPTPPRRDEIPDVIRFAADAAARYLDGIDDRPARDPDASEVALRFGGDLPEDGVGAIATLEELEAGLGGTVRTAGPRFFHFVNGGTTPAALGADMLASALDQNPGAWVSSPLTGHLERVALGLAARPVRPADEGGGVLTTGATMANFVALACARRWAGLRHGVDVDEAGMSGVPPIPVFGSGYTHPSDVKALGMLGDRARRRWSCSRATRWAGSTSTRSRRGSARSTAPRRS